MMLERYRAATREIRVSVARRVAKILGVREPRGRDGLFRALHEAGMCQADLVLCLLRLNALPEAERLVGRKIQICPACFSGIAPAIRWLYEGDRRRILKVGPNPCLPTTGAFQRYRILRVGMTVEQARRRGVGTRDIRVWGQKKFIEVETDAEENKATTSRRSQRKVSGLR